MPTKLWVYLTPLNQNEQMHDLSPEEQNDNFLSKGTQKIDGIGERR
jgi:hypothetical protein